MSTDWGTVIGVGAGVVGTLLSASLQSRGARKAEKDRRAEDRVDRREERKAELVAAEAERAAEAAAEHSRLVQRLRVAYVDGFVAVAKAFGDAQGSEENMTSSRAIESVRAAAHDVATVAATLAVVNGRGTQRSMALLNKVLENVEPFIQMSADMTFGPGEWARGPSRGPSVEDAIDDLIDHVERLINQPSAPPAVAPAAPTGSGAAAPP